MSQFKFELGAKVMIEASGEKGHVIGRCEHELAENSFHVRYKAAAE